MSKPPSFCSNVTFAVVLMLCGAWILWEVKTGGFRQMEEPSGARHGYWAGFVWVSAGPPDGGLYLKPPSSGGLCEGVITTPSASPLDLPRL